MPASLEMDAARVGTPMMTAVSLLEGRSRKLGRAWMDDVVVHVGHKARDKRDGRLTDREQNGCCTLPNLQPD